MKLTKKRQFRGTPLGSWPAFACRPALRSRQKPFFLFFFRHFCVLLGTSSTQKLVEIHNRLYKAIKNVANYTYFSRHLCLHDSLPVIEHKLLIWCHLFDLCPLNDISTGRYVSYSQLMWFPIHTHSRLRKISLTELCKLHHPVKKKYFLCFKLNRIGCCGFYHYPIQFKDFYCVLWFIVHLA